jgi:hypothetical protein
LLIRGEMMPPWGTPAAVGYRALESMKPQRSHFARIWVHGDVFF